jgi:hypothetical protein
MSLESERQTGIDEHRGHVDLETLCDWHRSQLKSKEIQEGTNHDQQLHQPQSAAGNGSKVL